MQTCTKKKKVSNVHLLKNLHLLVVHAEVGTVTGVLMPSDSFFWVPHHPGMHVTIYTLQMLFALMTYLSFDKIDLNLSFGFATWNWISIFRWERNKILKIKKLQGKIESCYKMKIHIQNCKTIIIGKETEIIFTKIRESGFISLLKQNYLEK